MENMQHARADRARFVLCVKACGKWRLTEAAEFLDTCHIRRATHPGAAAAPRSPLMSLMKPE